ncbi:MAG: hypothetical protein ACRDPT_10000 [Streptomycetales bacterium]
MQAARRLDLDEPLPQAGYLAWYRILNHGYPFRDYAANGALAADAELMAAYAQASPSPPIATPWPGRRVPLPPGNAEPGAAPSAELIAGWLRLAAGVLRTRDLGHSTVVFKSSPSGGARHPTDIGVHLGVGWSAPLAGRWWYDPVTHELVRRDGAEPEPPAGTAVFLVSSHVERAMWRYRDVRAFRPVLIDAGHVVETLLAVINACGWTGRWHPAGGFACGDQLDPVLGYVTATCGGQPPIAPEPPLLTAAGPAAAWRTNPLASLQVTAAAVRASVPGRLPVEVTPAMIDALAYATPSSRGDRPSGAADIRGATGCAAAELDTLAEQGLLVDVDAGDAVWRAGRAWFEHDWYLSLLAHAEEAGTVGAACAPIVTPAGLAAALDGRRTCRAFAGTALPADVARRVLDVAAQAPPGVSVVVVLRQPAGPRAAGVYELCDGRWLPSPLPVPGEAEIQEAAIGQPWAHGFALLVWLIPMPCTLPGSWEAALVDCGRVAQQIALAVAAHLSVGVFQSPALVDGLLGGILHDRGSRDGAYLVGVGVARDRPHTAPRQFRAVDVLWH